MSNHWMHWASHAGHAANHGSRFGAVLCIIIGFFFAPMLIGIPILIFGLIKLFSSGSSNGH